MDAGIWLFVPAVQLLPLALESEPNRPFIADYLTSDIWMFCFCFWVYGVIGIAIGLTREGIAEWWDSRKRGQKS
jgi:hypothetical protein